jgi:plastocyanin
MKMQWLAVGLLITGFAVYILRVNAFAAEEPTLVLIQNRQFVPSQLQIEVGKQVRFVNMDDVAYEFRIRKQGLTGVYKSKSKSFSPATSATGTTYTTSFGEDDVGNYEYVITGESPVVGNLVVVSVASSASPSASVSPTASVGASASVNPSPSLMVSLTPSPSVQVSPSASVVAVPSMTGSASPIASVSPSPSSSVSPTPSVPPLSGEDLPGFALLRRTSCTAEVVGSSVITERISSVKLIRGYWDITSLVQNQQGVKVNVSLDRVRVVNLFFRNSRFFRGDVTYNNLGETAIFEGENLGQVLDKAGDAWCRKAVFY